MEVYGYEGGIRYKVGDLPEPSAAFMKFIDSLPCTCRGEAHDECKPVCEECDGTGRWETTLEDRGDVLVDLGPCPECEGTGEA